MRQEFRARLAQLTKRASRNLSSPVLHAYRNVRHRLIAHTQVSFSEDSCDVFDIRTLRLKYGQERPLLTEAMDIIHELLGTVNGIDFSWESIRRLNTKDVCAFWNIQSLDERCPWERLSYQSQF